MGGLGVPNVSDYWNPQLRFLVEWNRDDTEKHLCFTDQVVVWIHISKVPWFNKKHRPWGTYLSLVTWAALQAWDRVECTRSLTSFLFSLTPIIYNPEFILAERELQEVWDFCVDKGVQSFEQLKTHYRLPDLDRFRNCHIKPWVTHFSIRPQASRSLTAFNKLIITKKMTNISCLTYINSYGAFGPPLGRTPTEKGGYWNWSGPSQRRNGQA